MGQETYVEQHVAKRESGTVQIDVGNVELKQSSTILLERSFGGGVTVTERANVLPVHLHRVSLFNDVLIRTLDIVGSIVMLLLAAPVMAFAAILVKVTSPGPVLYKQRRVGKAGGIFTLYKFRTMVDGAEKETGPVWATENDERVTFVGRILRRTRLDELPQLFNVLHGDMSLVGPRPERPYFVRQHKALQGVRLAVKPGITGLAQIRAFYNLKPDRKLKYDYLYIQNRSLFLNIFILLKTVPVVLLRKGW